MSPIPQWSGEVLQSNQYFWNYPAKPVFNLGRKPHGTYANGMSGSINNLEKITQQMGQMSIQTSQPTSS